MDTQFWHDRWESNQIGFHQDEINSHLQTYWSKLNLPKGACVFVPLCGKSRDMLWLLEQGYSVLGVEISPIAVADFFRENNLQAEITTEKGFQRWSCDELVILCGDFFSLSSEEVMTCHAIYDRASLIAMPPTMRPAYADKILQLFPAKRSTLLITMEYPQGEMKGPPFSVTADEVKNFYADNFQISQLFTQDILEESPRFKERGITHLHEIIYLLNPIAE